MLYVRFPLSLRNVEDLLFERGYDLCHETVRLWWNRFGPMIAGEIRRRRVNHMCGFRHWRWHLDEVYVKLNGGMVYLWRAVDHEGEILESYVTKTRDKAAALRFIEEGTQAAWIASDDRHRWAEILWCSDARPRQWREAGDRPPFQQPGREQPSALPTTRAGDAPIPANEDVTKVRLGPRQCRQPLFSRTSSRQSSGIQASPLGSPGRVAIPHGLTERPFHDQCVNQRQVRIGLTAPVGIVGDLRALIDDLALQIVVALDRGRSARWRPGPARRPQVHQPS